MAWIFVFPLNQRFLSICESRIPVVHPTKGYGLLKNKRCNKYLKLGLHHRSSCRNVCKPY